MMEGTMTASFQNRPNAFNAISRRHTINILAHGMINLNLVIPC